MNRCEFDAKQEAERIQNAMKQCAVIQFESGAYLRIVKGSYGRAIRDDFIKVNILADASLFVIGGPSLAEAQKRLTIRGEYYQVVILARVGALP